MGLLDFLYPPKCKICGKRISAGAVCEDCVEKLDKQKRPHELRFVVCGRSVEAKTLFPYENEIVKKLLFALKRNSDLSLFKFAGELYGSMVENDGKKYTVVNVPRSRKNRKRFGYDHVKLPCRIMCAKREDLQFCPLLKRIGGGTDQKNLNAEERKRNADGKFKAIKKDIQLNILLVDDVVTTASTATECAKELYRVYPSAQIKFVFLAGTGLNFSGK